MNDPKNDAPQDSITPTRFTRLARIALIIYIPAVLVGAPAVLSLFGYGLAHASDQSIAAFMIVFGILVVIAIALPLTLLLRRRGPFVSLLKTLGIIVMGFGGLGLLKILHLFVIEPTWMTWQFSKAMHAVQVVGMVEEPIYLQAQLVGITVNRSIELTRAVTLDQYGESVRELLTGVYVGVSGPSASNAIAPFSYGSPAGTVLFNNKPLDEALQTTMGSQPPASAQLPKGRYLTSRVFYLWGLNATNATEAPCRIDAEAITQQKTMYEGASNLPLQIVSSTRLSLKYRLGYRNYSTSQLPLMYRYEHSKWMEGLSRLQIESCTARDQRKKAEAERARAEQSERQYVAGDKQLSADDNPLYKEICAGDLSAVRARLALGTPPYEIGGKLFECTISKRNLDMFALLLPVLYAHANEREGYCSALDAAHRYRDLSMMETVVAIKLPLLCTDAEQPVMDYLRTNCGTAQMPDRCIANLARGSNAWRAGLVPVDAKGQVQNNFDPASRTDTVKWLQLLQSQGVLLCKTAADQTNLLQQIVARYPADAIEFLLKAGCDPHASPPLQPKLDNFNDLPNYSAAMLWFIRSIRDGNDRKTAPVDHTRASSITKAMGDINAEEINRFIPSHGGVLLHLIAGRLPEQPAAFRYLLKRGAQLNVADEYGSSWFDFIRVSTDDGYLEWKVLLDMLTLEQLDQLIHPVNIVTGKPGRELEGLSNKSEYGLHTYLCSRGAIKC